MFGSLVVVLPTSHEGGALVLRHNNEEWTFDSAKEISGHATPHVAYIAFYSDVEHEVTLVKSGYRVTVTYNLYFSTTPSATPTTPTVNEHPIVESALEVELRRLLADLTFVPQGGHLMFGLRHQYPVDLDTYYPRRDNKAALQAMVAYLKGSDAAILRVCRELVLKISLQLVFEDEVEGYRDEQGRYKPAKLLVACDQVVNLASDSAGDSELFDLLRECYDGKLLTSYEDDKADIDVLWATRLPKFNRLKAMYPAYGNEASLQHTYAHLCLLVDIGEVAKRETASS
ncbi:hypothetical protein B0H21DRAFT_714459 [Amylocystis lapponica]|nr:hypothetical protein B0H21DRAFT_714459 [Amylocystis lapponica]